MRSTLPQRVIRCVFFIFQNINLKKKEISSENRRSGPDLTKITTGPIVMRRDQSPTIPEKPTIMSHKSLSVENINKLKPVLMKNINLDKKVSFN